MEIIAEDYATDSSYYEMVVAIIDKYMKKEK